MNREEIEMLKSLGIHVGQPSLLVQTKDTVGDLIEKGLVNGDQSGRIGFPGNAADRLVSTLTQNNDVAKSMRQFIGKSDGADQYSKGDDNGDNFGSDNLKDTHGEQFHEDKHVTRKEVDDDKAHAVDRVHATEEESTPGTKKIITQKVDKKKETTSGDGLIKRSLTPQRDLFMKSLDDLCKSEEDMEDIEKKKKCMSPKSMRKGPIVEWAKEEEKEPAHQKSKHSSSDEMDGIFGKSLFQKKTDLSMIEEYKPSPDAMKSSLCSQFSWKIKELQEFKNSSWFMERELDDAAKSMAEKMYSKMKSEINSIVKKYENIGKSYAEVDQLCETLMKSTEACGAMLGQKKKAVKKSNVFDESPASMALDSLITMIEDKNDPHMLANVHENSAFGQRPEEPAMKSSVPFLKSAGAGGFVFDFGNMTGNPIADAATVLLNRHGDPTQIAIADDQRKSYDQSLSKFVKSGVSEQEGNGGQDWHKMFSKPMDQQVEEAYKSGAFDGNSGPAIKNKFNETEVTLGGQVIKATSETDAALIEMMKAEGVDLTGMLIADARGGGSESVTIDSRTGNIV